MRFAEETFHGEYEAVVAVHMDRNHLHAHIVINSMITGEKRLTLLLHDIGLDEKQIAEIFSHIYYYWNRDISSRIDSVHFFIDQDQVYRDDQLNHFAINLGGEILHCNGSIWV